MQAMLLWWGLAAAMLCTLCGASVQVLVGSISLKLKPSSASLCLFDYWRVAVPKENPGGVIRSSGSSHGA
jgi:hypothetical protein